MASLALRTCFSFSLVFQPTYVNLQESDAWYHQRLVDFQVHNFPRRLHFDPFFQPGGRVVGVAPLFDFLTALVAWCVGLGSPSPRLVEGVTAVVPAVIGALTVLPVYALAKRLFGARSGLYAAAVIAVIPGRFIERTTLGFADHHGAEALLSVMLVLFLCMAADEGIDDESHRMRKYGLSGLAGFTWGAYLLTWTSSALMGGVVGVWVAIQQVVDAVRGRSSLRILQVVLPAAAIAIGALYLFDQPSAGRFGPRVASVVSVAALAVLLPFAIRVFRLTRAAPRAGLVGAIGLASGVALLAVSAGPQGYRLLVKHVSELAPTPWVNTVGEAIPLFKAKDGVSLSVLPAWTFFRSAFFIGVAALVPLVGRLVRRGDAAASLFLVYACVTLVITLFQNRFAYYSAVPLSVLTGWACSAVLTWAQHEARPERQRARAARAAAQPNTLKTAAIVLLIAIVVFVPMASASVERVRKDTGMPVEWHEVLEWLRRTTPEPFQSSNAYFESPAPDGAKYPPIYSVLSWWDSGYLIMRVGRRVPVSNPAGYGAPEAARFFTATEEAAAVEILRRTGARYVISTDVMIMKPIGDGRIEGAFQNLATRAESPVSKYYEVLWVNREGTMRPRVYFHPAYYRAMATRLALYGGDAAEPRDSTVVVTYADRREGDGSSYRELVASQQFATFQEASAHLASLGEGPHFIAGRDPLTTCVPLEAMASLSLVYDSRDKDRTPTGRPSLRVFQVADSTGAAETSDRSVP